MREGYQANENRYASVYISQVITSCSIVYTSAKPEVVAVAVFLYVSSVFKTKYLNKYNKSQYRSVFLKKCRDTITIPNFLRFRVPENGIFSDQAVHSLKLKLQSTEMVRAKEDSGRAAEDLGEVRDIISILIADRLWPSLIMFYDEQRTTLLPRASVTVKKNENLSDRQVRPPRKMHRKSAKELDDIKLQGWVDELLSVGPKHRERDKFNDVHFLADIYKVFLNLN